MKKQIHFDDCARSRVKNGVDAIANAVKVTLGPRGRNVMIQRENQPPLVTKDGVSVAKEIDLTDELENLGAQLVREVASKTADIAGDGTTTATVLAQAMVQSGFEQLETTECEPGFLSRIFGGSSHYHAGADAQALRRGIEKAVKFVVEKLKEVSVPVEDDASLEHVASISANDPEVGKTIAAVVKGVGKDGAITVETNRRYGIETEVVGGMQFYKGWISQYMVTNQTKMIAEYENAPILIVDSRLGSILPLKQFLEELANKHGHKKLVVIAEDVEGEALNSFVLNKIRGTFNTVCVRAPEYGDHRKGMLEDIAAITGGTVISAERGITIDQIKFEHLGFADKVIVGRDFTTIIGGKGQPEVIEERIQSLTTLADEHTNVYERQKYQTRVAKMKGGVALIKVGAATETETQELKDRIDDAIRATKAAMDEGVVVGGGAALAHIANDLQWFQTGNDEEQLGVNVVWEALVAPLAQIALNAGRDPDEVIQRVLAGPSSKFGFNARTLEFEDDLMASGIIDPTKVTRTALENASSIATMLLTTEATITFEPTPEIKK